MVASSTMAIDLERDAKRFQDLGHKDIAQGISAWASVAKARGIETFSTPALPEGVIRLPDLTIGGKTSKELEKALVSNKINVSEWAKDMLRSKDFTTLPEQQTLSLVRAKVSDIGLTGTPTTDQIYARANELGWDLCPAEVAPHLRLVLKDQPLDDWFFIGMKQITGSSGCPDVFRLRRGGDGLWLGSDFASPGTGWAPEDGFVFSLRK